MEEMVDTWLENGSSSGSEFIARSSFLKDLNTDISSRGQITAWTGMIRVDGTNYLWMGAPGNSPAAATQTGFKYTSTKSIFSFNVGGKVEMNVTFISPLTPADQKRQSLVFSYLDVVVQSIDGASHTVQLYTDISAGKACATHLTFSSQLTLA
jgi:hypothetical protein